MKTANSSTEQVLKIDRLAELIYVRMCATSQHGFDATHYVKKSYELARVFHQHLADLKAETKSQTKSSNQSQR